MLYGEQEDWFALSKHMVSSVNAVLCRCPLPEVVGTASLLTSHKTMRGHTITLFITMARIVPSGSKWDKKLRQHCIVSSTTNTNAEPHHLWWSSRPKAAHACNYEVK